MTISEKLHALADRDRGRGLRDPAALRGHYALLGVDLDEMAEACSEYLRRPVDPVVLSLVGRIYEAGVDHGIAMKAET